MGKNMGLSAKECLEFSKKIAVLQKISRLGLVSESEYILAKNRIFDLYLQGYGAYTIARKLKEMGKNLPIIGETCYNGGSQMEKEATLLESGKENEDLCSFYEDELTELYSSCGSDTHCGL